MPCFSVECARRRDYGADAMAICQAERAAHRNRVRTAKWPDHHFAYLKHTENPTRMKEKLVLINMTAEPDREDDIDKSSQEIFAARESPRHPHESAHL